MKIKDLIIIILCAICTISLCFGVYCMVLVKRSTTNKSKVQYEYNLDDETNNTNPPEQEDDTVEPAQEDDTVEPAQEEYIEPEPVSMINCKYCEKEIKANDSNQICSECENESWSWHCTICDSELTQEEYNDMDSGGWCTICQENERIKQENSPYGICDLCGRSISKDANGIFVENNQDFCSGACKDRFFNRTASYGYCEYCTRPLTYSESYLFKSNCERCENVHK